MNLCNKVKENNELTKNSARNERCDQTKFKKWNIYPKQVKEMKGETKKRSNQLAFKIRTCNLFFPVVDRHLQVLHRLAAISDASNCSVQTSLSNTRLFNLGLFDVLRKNGKLETWFGRSPDRRAGSPGTRRGKPNLDLEIKGDHPDGPRLAFWICGLDGFPKASIWRQMEGNPVPFHQNPPPNLRDLPTPCPALGIKGGAIRQPREVEPRQPAAPTDPTDSSPCGILRRADFGRMARSFFSRPTRKGKGFSRIKGMQMFRRLLTLSFIYLDAQWLWEKKIGRPSLVG